MPFIFDNKKLKYAIYDQQDRNQMSSKIALWISLLESNQSVRGGEVRT